MELDDSIVQQTIGVGTIISRGLAPGALANDGYFQAQLENDHSAAATVSSTQNPYAVTPPAGSVYPATIGPELDVWLCGYTATATGLTGNLTGGVFSITLGADFLAFTNAAGGGGEFLIDRFSSESSVAGSVWLNPTTSLGKPALFLPIRVPRGATLDWTTTATVAANSYSLRMLLAVLPAGLGQDAIG